jgi:hypothetical protein
LDHFHGAPGSAAQVLITVVAPNETPPAGTVYSTNTIADAIDFLSQNTVKTQVRHSIRTESAGLRFNTHASINFSINSLDLNVNFDGLIIEGTREQNTTLVCAAAASYAININSARGISISYLNIQECWPTGTDPIL